jgi:hypothetical protein
LPQRLAASAVAMKNNLAADVRGMAYSIIDRIVAWEATPVDTPADEALAIDPPGGRGSDREAAAEWLLEAPADAPLESNEVLRQGKENGFSEKTLRRAAKQIGIVCRKAGFGGAWHWHPPAAGAAENGQDGRENSQDGQQNDVAIFDDSQIRRSRSAVAVSDVWISARNLS